MLRPIAEVTYRSGPKINHDPEKTYKERESRCRSRYTREAEHHDREPYILGVLLLTAAVSGIFGEGLPLFG
jgi:hypothetical protein